MRAATPDAVDAWSRRASTAWRPFTAPTQTDEELWMQKEDVASAWAVFALTGAAVALLLLLAVLG